MMVPLSIIIAAIVIAGALFMVNKDNSPKIDNGEKDTQIQEENSMSKMKPISADDHILGNPNADILIVEYSDTECPFCKQFHSTMHQVIDEYGKDGKVAWVYRHFPLAQLHPKAHKEAEATECAYDQGGNTAFWEYTDKIYEITPSNNGLDANKLPEIAEEMGLDRIEFERCLNDGDNKEKVADSVADAFASGGRGTPHNIMIVGDEKISIPGAQPFSTVKNMIDTALQAINADNKETTVEDTTKEAE